MKDIRLIVGKLGFVLVWLGLSFFGFLLSGGLFLALTEMGVLSGFPALWIWIGISLAVGLFGLLVSSRRVKVRNDRVVRPEDSVPEPAPEPMDAFFDSRVKGYDQHMLTEVEGCAEGYPLMASLIPEETKKLLDLGCGTGLELDEIFRRLPELSVTGVDLSSAMLERLKEKHPDADLTLICGDCFSQELGAGYGCAVSFESLHHFSPEQKSGLYRRVFEALTDTGVYIECDYMVDTQQEADLYVSQYAWLKVKHGLEEDRYYHYDTPCTVSRQIELLKNVGFSSVEQVFRKGGTCMLVAKKGNGR